ncbi:hypothetical protein BCV70DRAFT_233825 [Testicularia cyperi]|uniref:aspartyl aminopeptidase n=1 Tax=Testicularia cyperi TaxID=1882483 RepID=A0A317XHY4_9BASI|nr:hypothetical protein BCV70DRAFT_233825 [Testicularia cyperi]
MADSTTSYSQPPPPFPPNMASFPPPPPPMPGFGAQDPSSSTSGATAASQSQPQEPPLPADASQTLYIQNLNEKVKPPIMKATLENLFSNYANVLSVVSHTNLRMRGQAFVSLDDVKAADKARREVHLFPLYGKAIKISFAKTKSDSVVKAEHDEQGGEDSEAFQQHKEERLVRKKMARRGNVLRRRELERKIRAKRTAAGEILDSDTTAAGAPPPSKRAQQEMPDEYLPPNKMLFLQNIPEGVGKDELESLFSAYPVTQLVCLPACLPLSLSLVPLSHILPSYPFADSVGKLTSSSFYARLFGSFASRPVANSLRNSGPHQRSLHSSSSDSRSSASLTMPPFSKSQESSGSPIPDDDIAAARRFLKYVDASPTPFHAVATTSEMLDAAGFQRVKESELWDDTIKRGGKYYFTRNQSALVAFAIGEKYQPGNGVHVVGAHTDSPNFQIKPVSKRTKDGYLQCGVETYGGGIWASWFDRDLGLAGRVIVSDSKSHDSFTGKLVHIRRPILRIPTLAIHLNRTVNEAFKFNQEDNTVPILGLATEQLNKRAEAWAEVAKSTPQAVGSPIMADKHHSVLLELLASQLGVGVEQIQDFELSLYDTQPASIGGINNEFIHSPRLDNQMSCFCATEALIASLEGQAGAAALASSSSIRAIALFDNEEVGSVSSHGAESNMLPALIERLVSLPITTSSSGAAAPNNLYEQSIARSFLLSSDMAHGFHPNYPSYYEENHRPKLNHGPVIKTNVKQRYATTGPTSFLVRRIAQLASVPLQSFVVKNDMPCGSTIGPMLSKLGIRTVDLGNPQLSMHSIRETCGTKDVEHKINLFRQFFNSFEKVDAQLTID